MRMRAISIGVLVFCMAWFTFLAIVNQPAAPILLGIGLGIGWTVLFLLVRDVVTYAKAVRRYRPRPLVYASPDNRTIKLDANIVSFVSHPERHIAPSSPSGKRGYLVDFLTYRARRP